MARNAYIPVIPPNPTPWEVRGPFGGVRGTKKRDAVPEYCDIVDRWGFYVTQGMNPATARMIVDAVNQFCQGHNGGARTPNAGACKHGSVTAGETANLAKGA